MAMQIGGALSSYSGNVDALSKLIPQKEKNENEGQSSDVKELQGKSPLSLNLLDLDSSKKARESQSGDVKELQSKRAQGKEPAEKAREGQSSDEKELQSKKAQDKESAERAQSERAKRKRKKPRLEYTITYGDFIPDPSDPLNPRKGRWVYRQGPTFVMPEFGLGSGFDGIF